jgi:hypothetical protein
MTRRFHQLIPGTAAYGVGLVDFCTVLVLEFSHLFYFFNHILATGEGELILQVHKIETLLWIKNIYRLAQLSSLLSMGL